MSKYGKTGIVAHTLFKLIALLLIELGILMRGYWEGHACIHHQSLLSLPSTCMYLFKYADRVSESFSNFWWQKPYHNMQVVRLSSKKEKVKQ